MAASGTTITVILKAEDAAADDNDPLVFTQEPGFSHESTCPALVPEVHSVRLWLRM